MSPSQRIRRHLQRNIVAYLALFIALSGTALALPGRNNVKSKNIARGAVKGKALADGAVGKPKLRNGAVTSAKLDRGAVVAAALGAGAVTTPKLAEDSVTRQKIVQGSINGGKLANGSVDSSKVDNGSLLGEDFAAGQLSAGFLATLAPTFDDSGFVTVGPANASFATQRPGPLLVTATFASDIDCTVGPCTRDYVIEVDGADVPGTGRSLGVANGAQLTEQVTLIGLTPSLGAGAHAVDLQARTSAGTASTGEGSVSLAGILLQ